MSKKTIPRILVTRLSHIGDCVLTLPLVVELRKAFPNAVITWAIERPGFNLLRGHPDVDRWVIVPRNWLRKWTGIGRLRKTLRGLDVDLAVDPQSLTKSAALAWMSGARRRIGMGGHHGRELSPWLNNIRIVPESSHLVDRSIELLRGLNIATVPSVPVLPIAPPAVKPITRWLNASLGVRTFVAINPGASWPSKRWEPARFAAVARFCKDRYEFRSVVTWAGEEEFEIAQHIVGESRGAAVVAPRTNLQELAALLERAVLFVGCDSGPMHIAAAVGTPCIALFGPTRPQESGPYGPGHYAIQAWYQGGGHRQRRTAANDAMRDISTEQVTQTIDSALNNARTYRRAS